MKTTCHFCGTAAPLRFRTTDLNRHVSDETFAYFDCGGCGSLFLDPTPPDLGRYYPRDYYVLPRSVEELGVGARAEQYKLEMVQQFVRGGALLEIGPATGGFVYLAKEAGFRVSVIEMDAECCAWLGGPVGVEAVCSDDPPSVLPGMGPFDVIALWHVIEHVPDPQKLIAAAAERLAAGGILLLAAPNPSSLQLRLFGGRWVHVDAPRHLHLLPMSLLDRWATALGLEPLVATTTDPGTLGWNTFGWRFSLRNSLPSNRIGAALAVRGAPLLDAALGRVERSGGRGTTYTVIYRRPRA